MTVADRIALALLEHGPTSATQLALAIAARKADVLRELRQGARFECVGAGRGSRWRLATKPWEPKGTDYATGMALPPADDFLARLEAVEQRLAALEQRTGDTGAATK